MFFRLCGDNEVIGVSDETEFVAEKTLHTVECDVCEQGANDGSLTGSDFEPTDRDEKFDYKGSFIRFLQESGQAILFPKSSSLSLISFSIEVTLHEALLFVWHTQHDVSWQQAGFGVALAES